MLVQVGLCRIWSEPKLLVFSHTSSNKIKLVTYFVHVAKICSIYRLEMMPGDMKLCLDNTFSHFSNKLVFFEMISDNDDDDDVTASPFGQAAHDELQAIMDMTLDDFQVCMTIIAMFFFRKPVFFL